MNFRTFVSALIMLGVVLPRPPLFDYVKAVGCGDMLMAWNKDTSEVLSITLRGLSDFSGNTTLDLADPTQNVRVRVDAFEGPESFIRCDGDVGRPLSRIQDPTSGWLATSGKLRLSVNRRRTTTTVSLDGLVVQSIKGDRVRSKKVIRVAATIVRTVFG
jgi:hypothetical protein